VANRFEIADRRAPLNQRVEGSSPSAPTKQSLRLFFVLVGGQRRQQAFQSRVARSSIQEKTEPRLSSHQDTIAWAFGPRWRFNMSLFNALM
jgi:hypothetical protein